MELERSKKNHWKESNRRKHTYKMINLASRGGLRYASVGEKCNRDVICPRISSPLYEELGYFDDYDGKRPTDPNTELECRKNFLGIGKKENMRCRLPRGTQLVRGSKKGAVRGAIGVGAIASVPIGLATTAAGVGLGVAGAALGTAALATGAVGYGLKGAVKEGIKEGAQYEKQARKIVKDSNGNWSVKRKVTVPGAVVAGTLGKGLFGAVKGFGKGVWEGMKKGKNIISGKRSSPVNNINRALNVPQQPRYSKQGAQAPATPPRRQHQALSGRGSQNKKSTKCQDKKQDSCKKWFNGCKWDDSTEKCLSKKEYNAKEKARKEAKEAQNARKEREYLKQKEEERQALLQKTRHERVKHTSENAGVREVSLYLNSSRGKSTQSERTPAQQPAPAAAQPAPAAAQPAPRSVRFNLSPKKPAQPAAAQQPAAQAPSRMSHRPAAAAPAPPAAPAAPEFKIAPTPLKGSSPPRKPLPPPQQQVRTRHMPVGPLLTGGGGNKSTKRNTKAKANAKGRNSKANSKGKGKGKGRNQK